MYTKRPALALAGFVDADFANDNDNLKSISVHILLIAMNSISLHSQKQNCVSTSTIKAIYISISLTGKWLLWLQYAMKELAFISIPSPLSTDEEEVVDWTENSRIRHCNKHIDIAIHQIYDLVKSDKLVVLYIPSLSNPANICTKKLPELIFFIL